MRRFPLNASVRPNRRGIQTRSPGSQSMCQSRLACALRSRIEAFDIEASNDQEVDDWRKAER